MDTCAQCGFTYCALDRRQLTESIRFNGGGCAQRLGREAADLRRRRAPDEWSALEYACHVRDVVLVQRDRFFIALVADEPSFQPMYREQRVVFDRYAEQDPARVADQLVMAADMLAHLFDGLDASQWERPLLYNYPTPSRHDVEWLGHHSLHEMVHHLADIDRILGSP
jgi:hypothetical protein